MHVRPGDPIYETAEPAFFFTRYLTHFCAPTFIFLAGVSAWLYAHPAAGQFRSPSGFLFKRGFVIILFEIVFYYLVWASMFPTFMFLQVLFAIGVSMVALSFACRLNYWIIGGLGFVIVFGHNLLAPIDIASGEPGHVIWAMLHDGGDIFKIGPLTVQLSYPVLPWFGVIMLGYFAGPVLAQTVSPSTRRVTLIVAGIACLTLLAVLRGFNLYGETLPWQVQDTALATVMSFINFTKYPPSLDYLLLTLGGALLALAAFDGVKKLGPILKAIRTFGSVPMFVYLVHLFVLLGAYSVALAVFGPNHGERFGFDNVWSIWVGAAVLTLAMLPLANMFAAYKHRTKMEMPWLSYF